MASALVIRCNELKSHKSYTHLAHIVDILIMKMTELLSVMAVSIGIRYIKMPVVIMNIV
jgi:hypothetical protein